MFPRIQSTNDKKLTSIRHIDYQKKPNPNLCLLLAFLWAFAVTGSYPLTAEEKKENSQIDIKLKQNARSENKATRVIVNSVKVEKQTKIIPILGRFVAKESGFVTAEVNGAVKELKVSIGDFVKAGDIIARLHSKRLKWRKNIQLAEVSNFKAQAETKKAQVNLLLNERKRIVSLKRSPAFSQARLDDKDLEILIAKSEYEESKAKLLRSKANLELTAIDLIDAQIKAPYSGVVTEKHTERGAYLNIGAKVITLTNTQEIEVEADITSIHAATLTPGAKVTGTYLSSTITTLVRAVIPQEDSQTGTRPVRFTPQGLSLKNPPAINQAVTMYLPGFKSKKVLTVHKDAIITRKGKYQVVIARDGKAQFQEVILGEAIKNRFVVIRGLNPDSLVVIRGNERLQNNQPIVFNQPKN